MKFHGDDYQILPWLFFWATVILASALLMSTTTCNDYKARYEILTQPTEREAAVTGKK